MKAIIGDRYGSPDVLQLQDVPRPVPGDKEVLVRVRQFCRGSASRQGQRCWPTSRAAVVAGHAVDQLAHDVHVAGVSCGLLAMWISTQHSDTASPNQAAPVAPRLSSSINRSYVVRLARLAEHPIADGPWPRAALLNRGRRPGAIVHHPTPLVGPRRTRSSRRHDGRGTGGSRPPRPGGRADSAATVRQKRPRSERETSEAKRDDEVKRVRAVIADEGAGCSRARHVEEDASIRPFFQPRGPRNEQGDGPNHLPCPEDRQDVRG